MRVFLTGNALFNEQKRIIKSKNFLLPFMRLLCVYKLIAIKEPFCDMGKKSRCNHDELFTSFIRENKENFYRLAYSYVKNSEDALDIVQDSIHKAIVSMDSLQDIKTLKSWFYRIVVNTSLDFLRKHKRVSIVDAETMEFISSGSEDHYEDIDLERALDQLAPEYKSIIVLRFFEDLKIEEVADVLNENVNTIKTRLYKALKLLRVELNDEIIKGAN